MVLVTGMQQQQRAGGFRYSSILIKHAIFKLKKPAAG
jgi:hypothetical protein